MSLKSVGVIVIPDTGREFDHGAFEPTSGRVFVAHTAKDRLEVIDCASSVTWRRCRDFTKPRASLPRMGRF
jgi:hypothetical protein